MTPLQAVLIVTLSMGVGATGYRAYLVAHEIRENDPVRRYDNLRGCEENASNIHKTLFQVEDTLVYCETDRDAAKEKVKILESQGCRVPEQDTEE